jgi:hypothetical protein
VSESIVLGAGPVGLVAAYLLDVECVGEEPGGSSLRRYAPTYLWRTEATEQLLLDLDVPFEPTIERFGYLGDEGPKGDFTEEERIEYYRRSRGLAAGAPVEVPRSAMSSGAAGEIETFDVSVDELVEALLARVEVVKARAIALEVEDDGKGRRVPRIHVSLSNGRELLTRELVNTLPAPVFDDLVVYRGGSFRATPGTWEAGEKTFVRAPLEVCGDVLSRARNEFGFRYVYVVSADRIRFPYDRVNFVGADAILEFNGEAYPDVGEVVASGPFQVKGESRDPVEYGGAVRHLGRLARWSHSIRIHDVVGELYDVE